MQLTSAFLVMLGSVPGLKKNPEDNRHPRACVFGQSRRERRSRPGTFPESPKALVLVDVFVGLHGAVVAARHAVQVHLRLEPNLDHVGGLCEGHGHGAGGAAGQDTYQHAGI